VDAHSMRNYTVPPNKRIEQTRFARSSSARRSARGEMKRGDT